MSIPSRDELYNPLIQALKELGGSGSISEIEEKITEILKLSNKDISEIHRNSRTKLNYNLAWAQTYLKRYGILENSPQTEIWALTSHGKDIFKVDKNAVNKFVRSVADQAPDKETLEESPDKTIEWKEKYLECLKKLSPKDFEYLCQRMLRESGFTQVEVTGRSGDGGIDGRGIVKIQGIISFRIVFQCKRYTGSVSPKQIRDFIGAMTGRAEKGLFITTGTFTREARKEAKRDGVPLIDLIDREELLERMKELRLGVKITAKETIEVDEGWFKAF